MTKRTRPLMSNLFREIDLDLVSGVPLIRNSAINEIIIDRMKIQRHLKALQLHLQKMNKHQSRPHEPIDQ
ncbi:Uncharacterised protein [Staphylococcus aureus]|uniref:Uncharacterized protein n=1 Tax=Staphylococcus aureus TaxID=1280 RepID=A0A380EIY8_STAAU|nr:Uncharacterised protein [Staphylococcus aureus]